MVFNKAKCEFNKVCVVYYGLMFLKDEVSADPNKVQAIKREGQPRNANELNSFINSVSESSLQSLNGVKNTPRHSRN